ncbi:38185_t:CDS:1, partial [Gigaspora margarita]
FYLIKMPTWQKRKSNSQIDNIWLSPEIALDWSIPSLINPATITN